MRIYTKTGDTGDTGLIGGARVPKDDARIEAYGTIDELSSIIGLATTTQMPPPMASLLAEVQRDLFSLGAELASPEPPVSGPAIKVDHVQQLEGWIDEWQTALPPLRHFILAGGTPTAGFLHVARNVCRRAERRVVGLARAAPITPQVVPYLNRLSDLLFVIARAANHLSGVKDVLWKPSQST